MYNFGSTDLWPIMGGTSEWDVGCDEGVSEILAHSQEFGNRPKMTAKMANLGGRLPILVDSRPLPAIFSGR